MVMGPIMVRMQCLERPVLSGLAGPLPRALKKKWKVLCGSLVAYGSNLHAIEQ